MTASIPDQTAILAAASLEPMPPLPTAVPGPPAMASSSWSISTTSSMSEASASRRGSPVSRPAVSVSSTSRPAPDEVGHQCGEAVVVAETDLLVRHGVVLVDDGDHAELEQPAERLTGVEVLAAVDEVEGGEQDLAGDQPVAAEGVAPDPHQQVLAHRGHRLQRGQVRRAGRPSDRLVHPAAMAPEVTMTTRCPAARAWATSPASLSMASVSTRPSPVVTDDDPILTTRVRPAACHLSGAPAPAGGLAGELRLVPVPGERQVADVHRVPVPGTGPGQCPVHAQPPEPALDVVGRLVGGDVVEGDGPLRHPPEHGELALPHPLDGEALG